MTASTQGTFSLGFCIAFVATVACASCGDSDPGVGGGGSGSTSTTTSSGSTGSGGTQPSFVTGTWVGSASVEGTQFLKTGVSPVRAVVYEHEGTVRGFIDLEQTELGTLDSPTYYFEGEIDPEGALTVRLTERFCGAGEPVGLCYPDGAGKRLVYRASGSIDAGSLILGAAEVIPGSAPIPGDVPFEPPFSSLEAQRVAPTPAPATGTLEGKWQGECFVGRDVIYPLPLPFVGQNEMEIGAGAGGAPKLLSFVNEGITYWPSDDAPILLGDTLRLDEQNGWFWFVQVFLIDSRWLYLGVQEGDVLKLLIVADPLDPATSLWSASATPRDPLEATFLNTEGACYFSRSP
jgi:hypothetical protein